MTFIYLKDKQKYIDRYDMGTIEFCLDWYQSIFDSFKRTEMIRSLKSILTKNLILK